MAVKALQLLAVLLVAVIFVPGGAHLIELPNKIDLDRDEYLTVQQIYRGWALVAIPLTAALLATFALAVMSRFQRLPFLFSALSFVLLLVTLVSFFIWVFPVNQATENWTAAPADWQALRSQWEYAHAVNAVITLGALASAVLATLTWSSR